MKECFKIVPCQKREDTVRCKRLSKPKENWREESPDDNRPNKIRRQSGYIFQAHYCKVLPRCRVNTYGGTKIKMAENAKCARRSSAAHGAFKRKSPAIWTGPT